MKKRTSNSSLILALIFSSLLFYTCEPREKVGQLCGEENIHITINGTYFLYNEQNQLIESAPAIFARVQVYKISTDTTVGDKLLAQGSLDSNGSFIFEPANSECGISDIYIVATFENTSNGVPIYRQTNNLGYLCCDTEVNFDFNEYFEDTKKVDLSCENIDTLITLSFTNNLGACVPMESGVSDIYGNKITINASGRLLFDITDLLTPKNSIWVNASMGINPQPDENGMIEIEDTSLYITFGTETAIDTTYNATFNIPVSCIDVNGNEHGGGEVTIVIEAEICDNSVKCICPVGGNEIYPEMLSIIYSTSLNNSDGDNFTSGELGQIIDINLAEGCRLFVERIQRFEDEYADAYGNPNKAWNIVQPAETGLPLSLNSFDGFEIAANFSPDSAKNYNETFEVVLSVQNDDGSETEECSFRLTFRGKGCNDFCPVMIATKKAELENKGTGETIDIAPLDTVTFDENWTLNEKMANSQLRNSCFNLGGNPVLSSFVITMPQGITEYCEGAYVNIYKQNTGGDQQYFSDISIFNEALNTFGAIPLEIFFTPPHVNEHINSGHGSIYRGSFMVEAYSFDNRLICSQEINLEAEVKQVEISETEHEPLFAFSQISESKTTAYYDVYKLGYDPNDEKYGRKINLKRYTDEGGEYQVQSIGNRLVPSPDAPGTFYFEVDEPWDTDYGNQQIPKLYLVNSTLNRFSYITEVPVDTLLTPDGFSTRREEIIRKIFDVNGFMSYDNAVRFTFNPNEINGEFWNNSRNKSGFSFTNGIDLVLGGVYIIWNPNTNREQGLTNDVYGGLCDVALLYISGFDHGKNTDNLLHLALVKYEVGYPLTIVTD
ncbi:MAG: hypothetical protein K9H26_04330 [Prolixibacteraceae bacterium]|nr:hypothetical protein [Prolixibacteraceae bacterium]